MRSSFHKFLVFNKFKLIFYLKKQVLAVNQKSTNSWSKRADKPSQSMALKEAYKSG